MNGVARRRLDGRRTSPTSPGVCAQNWLIVLALGAAVAGLWAAPGRGESSADGKRLYRNYCASCHGIDGRGNGPDAGIFVTPPRNLREGFLTKYTTDDLVRRVREGRPLELALDLPALRARAADVEAIVAYLKRLPTLDWPVVARGQELFMDRCALCHGPLGKPGQVLPPGVRPPPDLSDPSVQASMGGAKLIDLVRHGREGMPALTPRVPEAAGPPLAAYVSVLSPGFTLYSQYCASCHGDDGRPPADVAPGIQRPGVVLDRSYFKSRDAEQLRTAVWHMIAAEKPAMPHYRRLLDEAQARAIVEYLKGGQ
jgi:mono/diheme cytochrome c family protein